jgi:general secretion pathway protein I
VRQDRHARGFTLIEVVVAFAILALALGALYGSFGGALRRSGTASQYELAQLRAASLLAEFRGSGGLLPAPRSGRDPDTGFDWRIVAKPYPAEVAATSAWTTEAVEVVVSWDPNGKRRVVLHGVELLRKEGT